jgi:hypothetical protein
VAEAQSTAGPADSSSEDEFSPWDCDDDPGRAWEKLHRTLVATDSAEAEVVGSVVGPATDIDGDGRMDLVVAFDDACITRLSSAGETGALLVWVPRGGFSLVLDRGESLRSVQPVGLKGAKHAWSGLAVAEERGKPAISAAAMRYGELAPAPTGEIFVFQWQRGKFTFVRKRVASRATGSASLVVHNAFGSTVELTIGVNGERQPGPYRINEGKTKSFRVPPGMLKWTPSWGEMPCQGGGDEPKMELLIAQGESALLECWQSGRMGQCCEFRGKKK